MDGCEACNEGVKLDDQVTNQFAVPEQIARKWGYRLTPALSANLIRYRFTGNVCAQES